MPDQAHNQGTDEPSSHAKNEQESESNRVESNVDGENQDSEILHFDDDDLADALQQASDDALDDAPFGVIRVDDDGLVDFYNRYESELSGMDPDAVLGKNFFTQVAPCTNNRLFRGRFRKGIQKGELDERFTYTYTYKVRPTLVNVRLCRDGAGTNWIVVQKY